MGCFTYTYNVIQPISVDLGTIADNNPNYNIRLFFMKFLGTFSIEYTNNNSQNKLE